MLVVGLHLFKNRTVSIELVRLSVLSILSANDHEVAVQRNPKHVGTSVRTYNRSAIYAYETLYCSTQYTSTKIN